MYIYLCAPAHGQMRAMVGARTPGARVLVVDDDAGIAETIRRILEARGLNVLVAADGAEALRLVELTALDVVLLDMRMPVLDGQGFVQALHERGVRIPIVVMTAGGSAQRWAEELAADGYLSKPFEIQQLIDVTARAVATPARRSGAVASGAPIRVVIADDHDGVRSSLRALFATVPNISVVGEASDGRAALAMVERLNPDILILDNQMPLLGGVEVARQLHQRSGRQPAIVFFSTEPIPADAADPRDRSVVKDAPGKDIVQAVIDAADAS